MPHLHNCIVRRTNDEQNIINSHVRVTFLQRYASSFQTTVARNNASSTTYPPIPTDNGPQALHCGKALQPPVVPRRLVRYGKWLCNKLLHSTFLPIRVRKRFSNGEP